MRFNLVDVSLADNEGVVAMGNGAIRQTESEDKIFTFDLPDDALERAASVSSLVFAEQFCRRPPRFILEIDIGKLLHVVVADNKAGFLFLDGPGRREAARISAR